MSIRILQPAWFNHLHLLSCRLPMSSKKCKHSSIFLVETIIGQFFSVSIYYYRQSIQCSFYLTLKISLCKLCVYLEKTDFHIEVNTIFFFNFQSRPMICAQGTFSAGGQVTCHQCHIGYSCESIYTNSSKPCPEGKTSSLSYRFLL